MSSTVVKVGCSLYKEMWRVSLYFRRCCCWGCSPQIMLMLELLLIPPFIRTDCGFVVTGREALCVLLYRMAFPTRLKDMRLVFGMSESRICETFNWMLHFLDFKWGFLLSLNVERVKPRLLEFAKAIYDSGAPLTHCWGSSTEPYVELQGTLKRPQEGQHSSVD